MSCNRCILLLIFIATSLSPVCQIIEPDTFGNKDSIPPLIFSVPLADSLIDFHWHQPENDKLLFLVIHDDENTSTSVGYAAMTSFNASLLELKNDDKYLITLIKDSIEYRFNPNRIFSLNGIESTLLQFGPCDQTVVSEINLFAHQVAGAFFLTPQFIVALHNNRNGGFSINSYLTDSALIKVTDSVFVNAEKDPDNFFYVIDPLHYEIIKKKGYNVILQVALIREDDGSMSKWASRMGIPYINIEAEHGHFEEQIQMLEDIREIIDLNIR